MSLSPTAETRSDRETYELGWVAVHRMLREGKSWSGREEDCSFWNTHDGRFANASAVTGLDLADDGRAAAFVDWNLDGHRDVWVAGRNSPRVRLFLNSGKGAGKSIELLLRGETCNKSAIGARVEVQLEGGKRLIQTLHAGEGYLAQSSKWVHVGLGTSAAIEHLTVRWPSRGSAPEEFTGIAPVGRFVLRQGTGKAEPWSAPTKAEALATHSIEALPLSEKAAIHLAARPPLPPLPIVLPDGRAADARTGVEPPLLLVMWSTTCAPCVAELTELARRQSELGRTGLSVLALSVDPEERRTAALDLLRRVQWEERAGFATVEALEALDALQRTVLDRKRRLPVPSAFLIDAQHRVAAIYKGPLDLDQLAAEAARLDVRPNEVRDNAVPFPGRWLSDVPQADLGALELAYAERKLDAAAGEVARLRMVTKQTSRASVLDEMGKVRASQGKLEEAIVSFREAVSLEPDFLDALVNLATALHQSGQVDQAIPFYEQALRIDSRNTTALYNLALARCALGHCEQARSELELLSLLDSAVAAKLQNQMDTLFRH